MKNALLSSMLVLGFSLSARADFSEHYDTPPLGDASPVAYTTLGAYGNWTLSGSGVGGANSGGVIGGPTDYLSVFGSAGTRSGYTLFTITPPVPEAIWNRHTVQFDYGVVNNNGSDSWGFYYDRVGTGAGLDPTYVSLSASGSYLSPEFHQGDVFGFYVFSDGLPRFGQGPSLSVDSFLAPVPEVSTILANGLVLVGIGGLVIHRKRDAIKSALS